MSDHLEFERPQGWDSLQDESDPEATPPQQAGPQAAPQPPQAPPPPPPFVPRVVNESSTTRILKRLALMVVAAVAIVLLVLAVIAGLVIHGALQPHDSHTPKPTVPDLQAKWTTRATQLRPDLAKPSLISGFDGTFDSNYVISNSKTWIVLTADEGKKRVQIHGLNPSTGEQRWSLNAAQGKCAAQLVDAALVCALATGVDTASGLGTKWRLVRLNPETGAVLTSGTFKGWLTLITVQHGRIVLVEQRLPAPHLAITTMNSKFGVEWRRDLAKEPHHDDLFSTNRITRGGSNTPEGPALDRPRIRQVANGLTALWAGQAAAFIDVVRKRVVAVEKCSRLVDDGKRLWCNDGSVAVAYSYSFHKLYHTPADIRLAFPDRDPRAGDITAPVFLNATGAAVRVDLTTGRVLGLLVPTRNGDSFGEGISPVARYLNGVSYISDESKTYAVKAATGQVLWTSDRLTYVSDGVFGWGDHLIFTGWPISVVDPANGNILTRRDSSVVSEVVVDDALVGAQMTGLVRLKNP